MKLAEFVNSFNLKFREVSNFVRYPIENISRITQRRIQNIYENIEVPGNSDRENSPESSQVTTSIPEKIEHKEEYNGYTSNGFDGNVTQRLPRQLINQQTNFSLLPPLKSNVEIRGRRGRYRVENIIVDKESERIREYFGIHILNNKPVWIKEYLLPESDFNQQETRERKDKFEELASVNFKSEEGKDFRLITPWDAIYSRDEGRCFLITEFIDNRITLRKYLENIQHAMTSKQVRKVLELVLVSLKYLHTDSKINLPVSQRPHGNLSLDSLLISKDKLDDNTQSEQFFIYLSDFALWENLFKLPNLKLNHPSRENDLQDLGTIAFYLLHGRDKHKNEGYYLNPKNEKHWEKINDVSLKNFIRRLLGLDTSFVSAEDALIFLLRLQPQLENTIEQVKVEAEDNQSELSKDSKFLPIALLVIIIGLLLGFVGGISWLLFNWMLKGKPPEITIVENSICCINKVEETEALKPNPIIYNVPSSETTLKYLMTTPNLVSPGKTFPKILGDRVQKDLQLKLDYKPVKTISNAIANLKNNDTQFFLTQHSDEELNNIPNANQLETEAVAYEGIVVFVPFSDSQRKNSFPEALNGKISFEDLRQLYTGKVSNWNKFNSKLPNSPVKLYIPQDEVLVDKFKKVVFENHRNEEQRFENLIKEGKIIKRNTPITLRNILNEFENQDKGGIGIGFGLLSKVYNQCAVYPLSIGEKGKEVQALVQNNGKDINPKINLCKKGGYYPNPEVMKKEDGYPLKYPISVVYPEDEEKSLAGRKFVEILKTDEGQSLLREAGLVPIRTIEDN